MQGDKQITSEVINPHRPSFTQTRDDVNDSVLLVEGMLKQMVLLFSCFVFLPAGPFFPPNLRAEGVEHAIFEPFGHVINQVLVFAFAVHAFVFFSQFKAVEYKGRIMVVV